MRGAASLWGILVVVILFYVLAIKLPSDQMGGLVTGAVALVGVFIAAEYGRLQFERRLQEDRDSRTEKRQFEAKQEAFISASEAILRALSYVTTSPDRSLPTDGLPVPEIQQVSIALNRLHFYGSMETVEMLTKLASTFLLGYIKILQAKLPSMFILSDVKNAEAEVAGYKQNIDRLDAQILAILSTDPNKPQLSRLRTQTAQIW